MQGKMKLAFFSSLCVCHCVILHIYISVIFGCHNFVRFICQAVHGFLDIEMTRKVPRHFVRFICPGFTYFQRGNGEGTKKKEGIEHHFSIEM